MTLDVKYVWQDPFLLLLWNEAAQEQRCDKRPRKEIQHPWAQTSSTLRESRDDRLMVICKFIRGITVGYSALLKIRFFKWAGYVISSYSAFNVSSASSTWLWIRLWPSRIHRREHWLESQLAHAFWLWREPFRRLLVFNLHLQRGPL